MMIAPTKTTTGAAHLRARHWASSLGAAALLISGCASTTEPAPRQADAPTVADSVAVASAVPVLTIAEAQGAGHRSPWIGREVRVDGVITAVETRGRRLFIQSLAPDSDDATSEGLCLNVDERQGSSPGDTVRAQGTIRELARRDNQLPLTCMEVASIETTGSAPLPEPVLLGADGRILPTQVDDDGLQRFEPQDDAADFFESLEGMRVRLRAPRTVGPTSKYGDVAVLVDTGHGSPSPTTGRNGLQQGDAPRVESLLLTADAGTSIPQLDVGTPLDGDAVGVLGYGFGGYRVLLTEPLEVLESGAPEPDPTSLRGDETRLSVGTFNVLNLSVDDSEHKFQRLAEVAARQMGAPDILCLQEVQDDSGDTDDGVVGAEKTLARLIETIVELGGPRYEARALDPAAMRQGEVQGLLLQTLPHHLRIWLSRRPR